MDTRERRDRSRSTASWRSSPGRSPSARPSRRVRPRSRGGTSIPRFPKRERDARPEDEARINERIRAREIRVVDMDGTQLGVMTPFDAIQRAVERGLDLVEVAPTANPPVCRIMDYGKYKYELKKKQAASKAKAHAATLKEVKLRPRTDDHDLDFKLKNARRFLIEGDKVKVTLMFRGREIVHTGLGFEQLNKVKELLVDIANVENAPRLEGRFMSMILVPNREAIARLERARATEGTGADAEPTEPTEPAAEERAAGES